jgi:hypothetical protein
MITMGILLWMKYRQIFGIAVGLSDRLFKAMNNSPMQEQFEPPLLVSKIIGMVFAIVLSFVTMRMLE